MSESTLERYCDYLVKRHNKYTSDARKTEKGSQSWCQCTHVAAAYDDALNALLELRNAERSIHIGN